MSSTDSTDGFVEVCLLEDLTEGKPLRREVAGIQLALVKLPDGVYAIHDVCPHAGASLAYGDLDGEVLACPKHGACFDVRTGRVLTLPSVRGVISFQTRIADGKVFASVHQINEVTPELLSLP